MFFSSLFILLLQAYPVLYAAEVSPAVPILAYHRFGQVAADSMTVTTPVFESHLKYIKDNGYTVISLRRYIDFRLGKAPSLSLPLKPVIITVDDGHRSVYTEMLPLVKKYRIPVTLFIYPSAISNASYAMTWDQLRELEKTGLFEIQSHTYWHPNFKKEKRRLAPGEYIKFLDMQMTKSKQRLEREVGTKIDMLAWPFGICDEELLVEAQKRGYSATFTIERRSAKGSDPVVALPRYLMTNDNRGKVFERMMAMGSGFES